MNWISICCDCREDAINEKNREEIVMRMDDQSAERFRSYLKTAINDPLPPLSINVGETDIGSPMSVSTAFTPSSANSQSVLALNCDASSTSSNNSRSVKRPREEGSDEPIIETHALSALSPHLKYPSGNRLAGKVVLVTGGGGAIGREIAFMMASQGAFVAVGDVDELAGDQTAAGVRVQGKAALFHPLDVTDKKSIQTAVDYVLSTWGRIDILINNATSYSLGTVENASEEEWERAFKVNVTGNRSITRYVAGYMKRHGGGSVVNISSVSGLVSNGASVAYSTSSASVLLLTKSVAHEFGKFNIRCNAICAGTIDTPSMEQEAKYSGVSRHEYEEKAMEKNLVGRLGRPEDVAHAAVFLASDESSFITGTTLNVDGGYTAV